MRTTFLLFFSALLNFAVAYEVLTISDSIVDHILFVDETFMETIPGTRGGSSLIDDASFRKILQSSPQNPLIRPGASAVNILKGLQHLGNSCALITTIGTDCEGEFLLKSLQALGIAAHLKTSATPTGKSACLVTPDGERTMRTFLGASMENDQLELCPEMFEGISHFHLEGYQLFHPELIKQAIALAKANSATISLDLSSFEVVTKNKDFIWELLRAHQIDIIFANKEEAYALTELEPKYAADLLVNYCTISVVTMGEHGCYTNHGDQQWRCDAYKVNITDTIGAGDLFISGFLHAFLTKKTTPECASLGTLLASHVVQVLGAEIPQERWEQIQTELFSSAERGKTHQG